MRTGDIHRVAAIAALGLRSDVTGNRPHSGPYRGYYQAGQKPPEYTESQPRGSAVVGHSGTETLHVDFYA